MSCSCMMCCDAAAAKPTSDMAELKMNLMTTPIEICIAYRSERRLSAVSEVVKRASWLEAVDCEWCGGNR